MQALVRPGQVSTAGMLNEKIVRPSLEFPAVSNMTSLFRWRRKTPRRLPLRQGHADPPELIGSCLNVLLVQKRCELALQGSSQLLAEVCRMVDVRGALRIDLGFD